MRVATQATVGEPRTQGDLGQLGADHDNGCRNRRPVQSGRRSDASVGATMQAWTHAARRRLGKRADDDHDHVPSDTGGTVSRGGAAAKRGQSAAGRPSARPGPQRGRATNTRAPLIQRIVAIVLIALVIGALVAVYATGMSSKTATTTTIPAPSTAPSIPDSTPQTLSGAPGQ